MCVCVLHKSIEASLGLLLQRLPLAFSGPWTCRRQRVQDVGRFTKECRWAKFLSSSPALPLRRAAALRPSELGETLQVSCRQDGREAPTGSASAGRVLT